MDAGSSAYTGDESIVSLTIQQRGGSTTKSSMLKHSPKILKVSPTSADVSVVKDGFEEVKTMSVLEKPKLPYKEKTFVLKSKNPNKISHYHFCRSKFGFHNRVNEYN